MIRSFWLALYLLPPLLFASEFTPEKSDEKGYIEPFQISDEVYYVGDKWTSSYLIDTGSGLVLLDTLEEPYSRWIPDNLRILGFDPNELTHIFITHGHSDHIGGAEYLQTTFGAEVYLAAQDLGLAKSQSQESSGRGVFSLPKLTLIDIDRMQVDIGVTTFTLHATPGHTHGCMSIEFIAHIDSVPHRSFVTCGGGTNFSGTHQAQDYIDSVAKIRALSRLQPVIEINLPSHPHLGQLFRRASAPSYKSFIDPSGFQAFLDLLDDRGREKLKQELER